MTQIDATPQVQSFFDAPTGTITYLVRDPASHAAAIIDPVLDYDAAAAHTSTTSADVLLAAVREQGLDVQWILETHAHADHLSAAGYLRDALGAPVAIGCGIVQVQQRFKALFGWGDEFVADGRQFDRLFDDGDAFAIGTLQAQVLATPGHTDDSLSYRIGDAVFIGDTLFAPAAGTARTDFPGGDAARLYASIRRLLSLPPQTRLFLCHDYPGEAKPATTQTTVAEQRAHNVHVGGDALEADFVARRQARDAVLPVPRLILPALQVNLRGGRLPPAEDDGVSYLRIPLNRLGAD
ncbi:MBL fold metallo-hydrolase [Pseudoxanthomonas sp.]|uniref:MBL fold metallo-hydrolase n=1 Tax=Pseudoxanthomonas sp. TaxID=1871049 RepID=UPI0026086EFE|nr:MBL fold metallo-hydrolase [Pseudoxanthomonas sp.]WDS37998.1 MAG: MBL fold metallo-hydrolase [Pseudoxanthomonas sp.]